MAAGGPSLQRLLRDIALNILKGRLKLSTAQKRKLRRHKAALRATASPKPSFKKRVTLQQKGGFLSAIITPILGAIASSVLS